MCLSWCWNTAMKRFLSTCKKCISRISKGAQTWTLPEVAWLIRLSPLCKQRVNRLVELWPGSRTTARTTQSITSTCCYRLLRISSAPEIKRQFFNPPNQAESAFRFAPCGGEFQSCASSYITVIKFAMRPLPVSIPQPQRRKTTLTSVAVMQLWRPVEQSNSWSGMQHARI